MSSRLCVEFGVLKQHHLITYDEKSPIPQHPHLEQPRITSKTWKPVLVLNSIGLNEGTVTGRKSKRGSADTMSKKFMQHGDMLICSTCTYDFLLRNTRFFVNSGFIQTKIMNILSLIACSRGH
jgi:hypothetical protein